VRPTVGHARCRIRSIQQRTTRDTPHSPILTPHNNIPSSHFLKNTITAAPTRPNFSFTVHFFSFLSWTLGVAKQKVVKQECKRTPHPQCSQPPTLRFQFVTPGHHSCSVPRLTPPGLGRAESNPRGRRSDAINPQPLPHFASCADGEVLEGAKFWREELRQHRRRRLPPRLWQKVEAAACRSASQWAC
jgi:hypothetical protein